MNLSDVIHSILRQDDWQKLLFGAQIDDNDLIELVKREKVIEATQNFVEQLKTEWNKFKGEDMKTNDPIQLTKDTQSSAASEIHSANKINQAYAASGNKDTVAVPTSATLPPHNVDKTNQTNNKGAVITPQSPPIVPPHSDSPIRFRLPNAKKGEKYEAVISADSGETIKVVSVKLEETGLKFDEEKQLIYGEANKSGEFKLYLQYRSKQNDVISGEAVLIVNPDPRELWKNIEPDKNLPYPKEHTSAVMKQENGFRIVAASRRGRSHEHSGSFRDDDFCIKYNNGWSVLVAADGAGSAKLSRAGSKEASCTISDMIINRLENEECVAISDLIAKWDDEASKAVYTKIYNLFQSAAKNAVDSIETFAKENGILPRDMATTLLAVISKKVGDKLFVASFWVGDGAIAAYRPNAETDKIKILGVPDEGEYSGQTRFLDRSILLDQTGFNNRIRVGLLVDVKALILMTDGVSDPKFETDNGLRDLNKWDDLWKEIEPLLSDEKPDEKLLKWLDFWSPGNHDDRTIVIQSFGK
jgi:hypothetical protein